MKRTKSNARKKSVRKPKHSGQVPSQNRQHVLATAIEHHQQGRLAEAQAGYLTVLKTDPDNADANHLMGVIAYQGGDLETASQLISKAVKIAPEQQQMHSNLGNVFQDQGLPQEAIDCYEKALAINPDFPEGHNNLGNAQKTCGLLEAAVASFKKALALRPDYIEANNNLGNTLKDLGQNTEAISYLRKAISLNPAYADAHYNLALALFNNAQQEEAVASCRQAIALKNDFIEARVNLSVFYQKMGRQEDSLAMARDAITIAPEDSSAHTARANVLGKLGLLDEALASYARAIELDPDNEEAHSNNLMTLHYAPNATTQDLLAAATQWAGPYNEDTHKGHFANSPEPQRRLRIGYVSADFSSHPVGFYLSQILPFHNAGSVEVFCYSNSQKSDGVTETLRASVSLWRDISGLSDADMVAQIKQDGIDILVDLSGHTAGNRLSVFAERPAPVQITWMGYTGTTGLTSIDYILADRFVVPENEKELFSESVKYLPGSYLCFAPPDFELACVAPPLKQSGHVTFGSFNNRIKITAETIAAWSRILTDVAGSQLLLKTPLLDDQSVRRSLLEQFAAHGIDAGRLILEGRAPRADLLKAYQRVDIALDTQPFGGGVTTAEALWMGVPVITLSSPRWSGRLGETILNAVGLPELIARDGGHYHDLAVSLANDLPRLEQMHENLRAKMQASPFCDGPTFASKLEQAYREIWTHWCGDAEPAAAIDVTETYAIAIDHHQNGRTVEAAEAYRKILEIDGNHIASLHNLGVIVSGDGDHQQAVDLFKKAIALNPGYARAYDSMGMALFKMAQTDEALDAFRHSLALDPTVAQVHYNLGTGLKEKGLLDEASVSYREALRLAPGNIDVLNNMAAILLEQKHPTEAAESFRNILAITPDFAEGHYNLGNASKDMGQFDEALASYTRAIELDPDNEEAWNNIGIATKLSAFTNSAKDRHGLLKPALCNGLHFARYEHNLNAYLPHQADETYDNVMALVTATTNGNTPSNALGGLPGNTVALLHFGRSGTGLMHSLIDNHPEVSTLPGVYLSGYFNEGVWEELSDGPIDELPQRFAETYEVMFDATSAKPVPGIDLKGLSPVGFQEGMNAVGDNRDEVLRVDREAFLSEARRLMADCSDINAGRFLRIVHAAYEHALGTQTDRHTLFYHIHNPGTSASFNFLANIPDARLMMMVRSPVQSLESWLNKAVNDSDYTVMTSRISSTLFAIDKIAFRKQPSIGVRLEDLKARPKATMQALCKWIGIEESPSLYEMTAQGKKWWGDPSSPDYNDKKEMSPFDDACVKRPLGTVFSQRDRFVMETLFHPFSVLFGYAQDDPETFKNNLEKTRGIVDGLLDFEQKIIDQTDIDQKKFRQQGDYLLFRAALADRLAVLEEFGTYPHMLKPLDIE